MLLRAMSLFYAARRPRERVCTQECAGRRGNIEESDRMTAEGGDAVINGRGFISNN